MEEGEERDVEIESGGEKVELPLLNGLVSRPTSVAAKTQLQPVGNNIKQQCLVRWTWIKLEDTWSWVICFQLV